MPSMVTRPVITSMANAIRLHWRRVVAVTWGWKQWKSATISTIGALRCGVGVVVLYNATLHDNGPPYLIFGEGIGLMERKLFPGMTSHSGGPSTSLKVLASLSTGQFPKCWVHTRNS